jgi:hypothetical protein
MTMPALVVQLHNHARADLAPSELATLEYTAWSLLAGSGTPSACHYHFINKKWYTSVEVPSRAPGYLR